MSYSVKKLAFTAVFVALSVICNIYTLFLGAGAVGISLTYLPIFLSGAFFGPSVGFFVGIFGDALGCIIAPQGPWIPFITLSSGLIGVIAGCLFMPKRHANKPLARYSYILRIALGLVLILLICTAGFNTVGLWLTYSIGKKTFWAYLAVRLPAQALTASINGVILLVLYPILRKVLALTFAQTKRTASRTTSKAQQAAAAVQKNDKTTSPTGAASKQKAICADEISASSNANPTALA